jgi:hypothetical protein
MAFDINGQFLDMNTIKLADGSFYSGPDEVRRMLAQAWQEVEKRFFKKGEPVIFNTPGIRSGIGKGNLGYGYPRVVNMKTKRGDVTVAWYETKTVENGKTVYSPLTKKIGPNNRTLILKEENIEEILFMMLFNKDVGGNGKLGGKTFMQDLEAEAVEFEAKEAQEAVVYYWLYTETSPFYNNFEKLSTIARVYGIEPEGKTVVYLKKLIALEVRQAEKRKDNEFNLKAFRDYCERLNGNYDIRDIEAMNLIQMATKRQLIAYDEQRFVWQLIDEKRKPMKTICKVAPQMAAQYKIALKKHLMGSAEDMELLRTGLSIETSPGRFDRVRLTVPLPADVTEDFVVNELDWNDYKRLYNYLTNDPNGSRNKTKEQILPILLEKLVINQQVVPFEVIK